MFSPAGAKAAPYNELLRPASPYAVLYSFAGGSDGAQPFGAGLINVNGTLYGTTDYGGGGACSSGGGCGTVFKISRGGTEQVLHGFTGGSDGDQPEAGLTSVNGTLFGTTAGGGSSGCFSGLGCGTVFQITTKGVEKVLHSFAGGVHGFTPLTGLVAVNGTLYGTTAYGGGSGCFSGTGCGTVFRMSTDGSGFKTIYSFAGGSDGADPRGDLINVGGTLYGTTAFGGGTGCSSGLGCGTVFRVTTSGTEKVFHNFGSGADGGNSEARLLDVKGTLYGTTFADGISGCLGHGCGSVFRLSTGGASFKVLHKFSGGNDGGNPAAGLIDVNGTLYGTTYTGGGTYGNGAVFRISTSGAVKVLHGFGSKNDGVNPTARLLEVNGKLYGTTTLGGTHTYGTVFTLTP